jgi:hypothetical protein
MYACRQPNVDACRPQGNTTVAAAFEAFCNNTQQVQANCIHAGRYCQPQDPDGSPGGSRGREALIEMLRSKCVLEVSRKFEGSQYFFAYMQVRVFKHSNSPMFNLCSSAAGLLCRGMCSSADRGPLLASFSWTKVFEIDRGAFFPE